MPDPLSIATFRFGVISPLLDDTLGPGARKRLVTERSRQPVLWPSGEMKPVARSTIYRWWKAYQCNGLGGLLPVPRKDRGVLRSDRAQATERALHLLLERPDRSLNLVLALLEAEQPGLVIARSTLQRDLSQHPAYRELRRERRTGDRQLRTRFEARAPHDIWQLDAKGPFAVTIGEQETRATILSILDDHSRALLATVAADREKLGPAVKAFRAAAARWGLPKKIYCDRHATYDSLAFRTGLAVVGVHRIASRPRSPAARGKIERYHGFLRGWFIGELKHQVVLSLAHLNDLLQAFQDLLYNAHRHRGLKMTPAECLAGRRSSRLVSLDDLHRAFWVEKRRKIHPKTGEVELPGGTFRTPAQYAGQRVLLRYDPVDLDRVHLVGPGGKELPLRPVRPQEKTAPPSAQPSAPGRLQPVLDRWRGRELPIAPAAFGLPEIFAALSAHLGRGVPGTKREAQTVQAFYRQNGPFRAADFQAALEKARTSLGSGRPLQVVLAYLVKATKRAADPPEDLV